MHFGSSGVVGACGTTGSAEDSYERLLSAQPRSSVYWLRLKAALFGLLDERDKWHTTAVAIRDTLLRADAELVFLDCVLSEVISVIARRTQEQRRPEQFDALMDELTKSIPTSNITWVSGEIERLYDQVLGLIRSSAGELNFHDALIALICREQDISVLASFDTDFDRIDWLARVGSPEEISGVLQTVK